MIVPQAVRIIIPPTGNEFITLLKLTSLGFVISLHELLTASQVRASSDFRYVEAYTAATLRSSYPAAISSRAARALVRSSTHAQ